MNDDFPGFEECIKKIRSNDALTYEDGFWWLIDRVPQYKNELIELMQAEEDPRTRAKFIELLGDAKDSKIIPLLTTELKHSDREVRYWAVLSLEYSGFPEAEEIARNYKDKHPEEWAD